eukprot:CAMPEP_0169484804 /NCGR_PEP_ID=MMETSP1042-20121227/31958_1 /TAXON_ID=464988 /ORGANISM="Hemiselmis andersenii, Strain CCMP1180" /LENGTH=200 /DNA_ID=CAMNT_0009599871 /DNA_START=54 /DNA_END=657 /DNA_ORIENTATION=+
MPKPPARGVPGHTRQKVCLLLTLSLSEGVPPPDPLLGVAEEGVDDPVTEGMLVPRHTPRHLRLYERQVAAELRLKVDDVWVVVQLVHWEHVPALDPPLREQRVVPRLHAQQRNPAQSAWWRRVRGRGQILLSETARPGASEGTPGGGTSSPCCTPPPHRRLLDPPHVLLVLEPVADAHPRGDRVVLPPAAQELDQLVASC